MTTVNDEQPNTYFYLKDHQNSVIALADEDGQIVETYTYDAWGRTRVFDAEGNELTASAFGNRFAWQGREIDWSTGLYYFRARYYDPITGRWLSNDPVGISGGLNQYVFCNNNPVNFTDPWGHRFCSARPVYINGFPPYPGVASGALGAASSFGEAVGGIGGIVGVWPSEQLNGLDAFYEMAAEMQYANEHYAPGTRYNIVIDGRVNPTTGAVLTRPGTRIIDMRVPTSPNHPNGRNPRNPGTDGESDDKP